MFVCLFFVPQPPGRGFDVEVPSEKQEMLPCPSPTLTPFSISLIACYYGAPSFHQG